MKTTRSLVCLLFFIGIFVLTLANNTFSASELYFIDAHSQVDHKLENLEIIIQRMDKTGVYRTMLAARGKLKGREITQLAEAYPDRIIAAIRTKGGAYKRNEQNYYNKLKKRSESKKYNAIAEVLIYHAQKGDKAGEVIVYPDDERVQAALNIAIENGWPFIVHIEFAAIQFRTRQSFMKALEEMLDKHPEHPFALIHMGQLEPNEARNLIEKHKNIYFLTSHADPVTVDISNQPWVNMFEDHAFTPEWKELMIQHSDRFIFAIDNVWAEHWNDYYIEKMEYWGKAISVLPDKVAHAIAHGNAERLWKIPVKGSK